MHKIQKIAFRRIDIYFVAALALSLPIIFQIPEMAPNSDLVLHFHRMVASGNNLKEGFFWPRWYPNVHLGYGYPVANFYPPGTSLIGGALVAMGVPAIGALKILQAGGIMLMGSGAYIFARTFARPPAALFAGTLFLYTPFNLIMMLYQGNVAQLYALALCLWALWAVGRCIHSPRPGTILVAGCMLAGIILTHHLTTLLFFPLAAIYGAIMAGFAYPLKKSRHLHFSDVIDRAPTRESTRRDSIHAVRSRNYHILALLAALGLGIMLGAIYWLPAAWEAQFTMPISAATSGWADIRSNFTTPGNLLQSIRPPDRAMMNPYPIYTLGQLQVAVAALGLVAALLPFVRISGWKRACTLFGGVVALLVIMMNDYHSLWLWDAIPGAGLVQFPWRLLGLGSMMMIPAAGLAAQFLPERFRGGVLLAGIGVVVFSALPLIYPFFPDEIHYDEVTPGTAIEFEREYGGFGTVISDEYRPEWALERPMLSGCAACYESWDWRIYPEKTLLPDGVRVEIMNGEKTGGTRFKIQSDADFRLVLHQMYFPGWQARRGDHEISIQIEAPYGLMALDVPAGDAEIEVWYSGSAAGFSGGFLSGLALMVCVALAVRGFRRKGVEADSSPDPVSRILAAGVIAGAIGLTLANGLYIEPETNWFRAKGSPSAPLYLEHEARHVFVDDAGRPQIELLGYDISHPDGAAYGDWVYVDLYWAAAETLNENWNVKVELLDPVTGLGWTGTEKIAPGALPTVLWPHDKYLRDRHILRIGDDVPPYVGNVSVSAYNATQGVLKTEEGREKVVIAALRINGQDDSAIPEDARTVQMNYGESIELRAYRLDHEGEFTILEFFWKVRQNPDAEYTLFIHFLDGDQFLEGADQAPIPSYPTHLWQKGQYLRGQINLNLPQEADRILVGFYDRETMARLPAGSKLETSEIRDDGLVIPLE